MVGSPRSSPNGSPRLDDTRLTDPFFTEIGLEPESVLATYAEWAGRAEPMVVLVTELELGESVQIAGKYSLRLFSAPTRTPTKTPAKDKESDQLKVGETMIVNTTTLTRVGQSTRPAYLTLSRPGRPSWIIRLEKSSTSIGRKRSSDIRVGGWFSPAMLATVERRDDGFYLAVHKSNQVFMDGESVNDEHRLEEGDRVQLLDVTGVFHERTNLKRG